MSSRVQGADARAGEDVGSRNCKPWHPNWIALVRRLGLSVELSETRFLSHVLTSPTLDLRSGPVTAGVLRGERSRFQLFGDTV